jgi:hypothetical protein
MDSETEAKMLNPEKEKVVLYIALLQCRHLNLKEKTFYND